MVRPVWPYLAIGALYRKLSGNANPRAIFPIPHTMREIRRSFVLECNNGHAWPDGNGISNGHIKPIGWIKPVLCIIPVKDD